MKNHILSLHKKKSRHPGRHKKRPQLFIANETFRSLIPRKSLTKYEHIKLFLFFFFKKKQPSVVENIKLLTREMHSVFPEVVFNQGLGNFRDRVNKNLVT